MESAAERGRLKSSPNVTPHIQTLFDLCREAGAEMVSAVTAADPSQSTEGGLS